MTASPLVSVIMPVRNGARFIAAAIASIGAQDHDAIEIIVVDDGSSDRSAELAASGDARVRVLRQAHAGLPTARNAGLARARGDVVAFLDHDDLWPAGTLTALLAALAGPPPADVAYGRTRLIGEGLPSPDGAAQGRIEGPAVALGSALIRRALFGRVGTFAADLPVSDDLDWLMRARELGCPIVMIERVTLWHRVHPDQMTADAAETMRQAAVALKRSLDRRRAGGRTPASLPGLPLATGARTRR